MWLPWNIAVLLAFSVGGLGLLARQARRPVVVTAGAVAREAALVLVLYAIWRIAGTLSVMHVDGALGRGRSIWDLEQRLHLPSEAAIQHAFLPHSLAVQAMNGYYAIVHVPALIIFLIWLFAAHRHRYPTVRNVIALTTGACLLIQLVPVAPPRMYPQLGFVDTGHLYGQSVYGAIGNGIADQLSAMPSVHVAWAVLIGAVAFRIGRSRWKWIAVAHSALTVLVVVATANHWWLDGVVAVGLIGAAVVVERAGRAALGARMRWRSPAPIGVPVGAMSDAATAGPVGSGIG